VARPPPSDARLEGRGARRRGPSATCRFVVEGASGAEALSAWHTECDHARRIEASVASLDTTFSVPAWESEASLRTLLLHLIHEYARHNDHADLIREAIDGATGP
jgi:hypothetical protein